MEDERLYSKDQVSNMMVNTMEGYDRGYYRGRERGKVDGFLGSLAMTACCLVAAKIYGSYVKRQSEKPEEEEKKEDDVVGDAEFEEV